MPVGVAVVELRKASLRNFGDFLSNVEPDGVEERRATCLDKRQKSFSCARFSRGDSLLRRLSNHQQLVGELFQAGAKRRKDRARGIFALSDKGLSTVRVSMSDELLS